MAAMNPYALPNVAAFVLLLVFSLAVIFQNPRDKSNIGSHIRGFRSSDQLHRLIISL